MKLVIGHLYYDLMNLYGENGNIKVLEYQLKKQGIDIDKKKVLIDCPLSCLGYHNIKINLHKKVLANLKVELIKES